MMKILIFGAALLAVATAQANENIAEFKDGFLVPVQSGAIPFVYQSALRKRFAEAEHRTLTPAAGEGGQGVSKLSLGLGVVSAVTSKIYAIGKYITTFIISSLPQLILGGVIAVGICKLTPICSQLEHITAEDVRSLASPERLTRAAKFVEQAIDKFTAMQDDLSITRDAVK